MWNVQLSFEGGTAVEDVEFINICQRTTLLQKKAIANNAHEAKVDIKFDCVGSTDLENN